jgi:hypothetical protein
MKLSRIKVLLLTQILFVSSISAQIKYDLLHPESIQKRLGLYKGNDSDREMALVKLFKEAGCADPNLSEQAVPKRKQPNVICVLPGNTPAVIVIGAHFDHIDEGRGVIDNWSGASLLPSLFQSLSTSQRKHTFVFVGFTGEEAGEIGSTFYVKQLSKDQLSRIQLMVNLDSLGLGPTKVWISRSDKHAIDLLGWTAHSTSLPIAGVDVDGFGESDEESFIRQKVCTVTIHSVTPENARVLHSASDSPSAMHFQDYYDTYRLLVAYLSVLDAQLDPESYSCAGKSK